VKNLAGWVKYRPKCFELNYASGSNRICDIVFAAIFIDVVVKMCKITLTSLFYQDNLSVGNGNL